MSNTTERRWPVCLTEYKEELHMKNLYNEGKAQGLAILFSFVADGTIAMELAAERAQISLEEFKKMYEEWGKTSKNTLS